jgi:hypothetical protein
VVLGWVLEHATDDLELVAERPEQTYGSNDTSKTPAESEERVSTRRVGLVCDITNGAAELGG